MQTKLTLRLEDELIRRAKTYARKTGRSVSEIVGDYFSLLDQERKVPAEPLPPTTQMLKGILRASDLDEESYRGHLVEKYT